MDSLEFSSVMLFPFCNIRYLNYSNIYLLLTLIFFNCLKFLKDQRSYAVNFFENYILICPKYLGRNKMGKKVWKDILDSFDS